MKIFESLKVEISLKIQVIFYRLLTYTIKFHHHELKNCGVHAFYYHFKETNEQLLCALFQ